MVQTFILDLKDVVTREPVLDGYKLLKCESKQLDIEIVVGQSMNGLFQQLQEQGFEVTSMRNKTNRLEEFFLRLVNQSEAA